MKKCKGINKARGFDGCGELKSNRKYGLCINCFREWARSTPEGSEWIKSNLIPKAKKKVEDRKKSETRDLKEKLKTVSQIKNEARTVFQKWIRKRDENKPCISCGSFQSDLWDGGHFYKAEIYSGLIFDERNCNKQCRKCNRFLGGNENNYRLGLIERHGISFMLQLDADAIKLRDYKYSIDELRGIKKEYQERLNSLK